MEEVIRSVVANEANATSSSSAAAASQTNGVDSIVSRLKQEEVEAADREIQAAMLDIGKSMSMNSSISTR